jgi:hypothetical protein
VTDADPDEHFCECGKPLVCFICESCPEHCLTDGDPDACWEAHESWRLGKGDPTFGEVVAARPPPPGIPPAPKPRWQK